MTALFFSAIASAALPIELGPAWAEFSSDASNFSIETRIEIGTRGYDDDRGQLDFWLRRTVTTRDVPVVSWTDSRTCPAVCDILASLRNLPVPRFAEPYMRAVINHPFMQEWIGGAQAEDWVIDRFELPALG